MSSRPAVRELLVFVAFAGLTVLMTWPWARLMPAAVGDDGDSYLNAWILWWDYHQTFTDPLRLFHANILYPYRYTLAFSEHNYGISLLFFPLYAAGLRPLTVHGVATLAGFALCGYGAFRLARTLTGSAGAAWVAGVAFAFVPYRFHHLPHITYLFAGWIPLALEALVLYARAPTWRRAAWLGAAFFMNALTCIHWLVLTLIPLGATGLFLAARHGRWREGAFWLRMALALGASGAALLPFLAPYLRVSKLYGLVRSREEAEFFSAGFAHWVSVDWQNKLWGGLGREFTPYQTELALFPGLVPVLLALAALFFSARRGRGAEGVGGESRGAGDAVPAAGIEVKPGGGGGGRGRRALTFAFGALALACGVVALSSFVAGGFRLGLFGVQLLSASGPRRSLLLAVVFLGALCVVSPPRPLRRVSAWAASRVSFLSEASGVGLIWLLCGFAGSFGMNFFFHRLLFEYVTIFRSIRVPARWAMVCFVGLSLLAGIGASRIAGWSARRRSKALGGAMFALAAALLLFEQRAAPLSVVRGAIDPDPVTLWLKRTPMRGGVVELPSGVGHSNYLYVLRAADHARPLVNGVSGFQPPVVRAVEGMTRGPRFPDRLFDLLEAIPVSYLVIHNAALDAEDRAATRDFVGRGVSAGRLRLAARFGEAEAGDEVFAVVKTEPAAAGWAAGPNEMNAGRESE